ncbi:MAG: class II glutamine amidotransferase, partial [Verrucomicrobiales bacterium]|nr:class II glutamine amidotransferase [Verrucomicrobiales bacterium]
MCGIVGYVGKASATSVLIDGLRRLEYRGYDSSGLAVMNGSHSIEMRKRSGRLDNLKQLLAEDPADGDCGISHTRWATHGEPTDVNAHPHTDQSGKLVMVHNGVIENYQSLKEQMQAEGHEFQSQTDSEVLAHLVGKCFDNSPETDDRKRLVGAVREALTMVSGTYGIVVMHADVPKFLVGARLGSPLVVGLGKGEKFLASDVGAIVSHTSDAIYMRDR